MGQRRLNQGREKRAEELQRLRIIMRGQLSLTEFIENPGRRLRQRGGRRRGRKRKRERNEGKEVKGERRRNQINP